MDDGEGEAEVADDEMTGLVFEDVLGFEIAVEEAEGPELV